VPVTIDGGGMRMRLGVLLSSHDWVLRMKWLTECSAEALGKALRVVAPELSGCRVTVPVPDPAVKGDPAVVVVQQVSATDNMTRRRL
jgi:hypothetical protein